MDKKTDYAETVTEISVYKYFFLSSIKYVFYRNTIQILPSIEVNTWIYRPKNIYRPRTIHGFIDL